MERLVLAVGKSSGVKKSLEEAEGYIQKSLHSLESMPDCIERQALHDLARYIVARKI
jgi:geranylgeranyl pyrophosphate synthase